MVAQQFHGFIWIAVDAGIDHGLVLGQFVPLQNLFQGKEAISFRRIEQLLADAFHPSAVAAADQSHVKCFVSAFPIGVLDMSSLSARDSRQAVQRQDEILLPLDVKSRDRLSNGQAVDPASRLHQFFQFIVTDRGDAKSFLFLQRHESFGEQAIQGFTNRAGGRVEALAERDGSNFFSGTQPPRQDVRAQLLVHRFGERRRLPVASERLRGGILAGKLSFGGRGSHIGRTLFQFGFQFGLRLKTTSRTWQIHNLSRMSKF